MPESNSAATDVLADRASFYREVRGFLDSLNADDGEEPLAQEVGEDENLFDAGLLTSFSVVRLVSHLQDRTGVSIDFTTQQVESFYTLRSLYGVFAAETAKA